MHSYSFRIEHEKYDEHHETYAIYRHFHVDEGVTSVPELITTAPTRQEAQDLVDYMLGSDRVAHLVWNSKEVILTNAEIDEWTRAFNDAVSLDGLKTSIPLDEVAQLAVKMLEEQIAEDENAETFDSGIILRNLADAGYHGAFETKFGPKLDVAWEWHQQHVVQPKMRALG